MKIGNIELFPNNVMAIIAQQEYIGIRLSGGIDSAILCHIVLKHFPQVKLIPITFYNVLRPAAENSVNNVLRILLELNPNSNLLPSEVGRFDTSDFVVIPNYVGPKYHPKDILQRQFVRALFDKYDGKLNFILSGETINPPIDEQIKLGMEMEFLKERNIKKNKLLYEYVHNNKTRYEYSPFRNNHKKDIAKICKELGLMDSLLPYTETCETIPDDYINRIHQVYGMTYTAPGVEPCQCCWPCREKYWAYKVFDFNTPLRVDLNIRPK